ncbi:hypothetical protein DFH29DRAFT_875705 [Suillus ampliporus]|nr:hypothetical protein DFH29DRAFT_875705 [Suillus ampliporus]
MSNVPKFLAVCAYIDKIDTNDVEGAHQYVTDDFVYEAEPKPVGILGASYHDEDGFNQASYKVFRDTVAKHITQKGNGVYQQTVTASSTTPPHTGEIPFTAEFEFVGDKIRKVKMTASHALPFLK